MCYIVSYEVFYDKVNTVSFPIQSTLVIVYLVIVEYLEIVEKTPATVFLFLVSLLSRNSGLFVIVDSFRATNESTITRGDSTIEDDLR